MSEMVMVERVARALFVAHYGSRDEIEDPPLSPKWTDLARAAILSMREPTEGMLSVGCSTSFSDGGEMHSFEYVSSDDLKEFWHDAIDTALGQ